MNTTTTTPVRPAPGNIEALYHEYAPLVRRLTRKFHRSHGGDLEEMEVDGFLYFLQALRTYDRDRGGLERWIGYAVWHLFLEAHRTRCRRAGLLRRKGASSGAFRRHACSPPAADEQASLDHVHAPPAAGLAAITADLSDDARTVVDMLVEDPDEPNVGRLVAVVTMYLLDLGWACSRVLSCLEEVKEALP